MMATCYVCEELILAVGGTASQPRRVTIDGAQELVHQDCYEVIESILGGPEGEDYTTFSVA
jgi:hypothetical protein